MNIDIILSEYKYKPKTPEDIEKFDKVREATKELSLMLLELCPNNYHRDEALKKLKESAMWANSSIANSEPKENS